MAFDRIRNLRPVKRHCSERYVLISLVSFALTVVILRVILWLTGYVQLGNDTVHIAHVLWGGLVLFGASLVLLTIGNRWALAVGSIMSGIGIGLFIDEVGKFITQNNDYFTPAAAPIIYALFLAVVVLYLRLRRPPEKQTRGEMYRALEQMKDVLDQQMSQHELSTLAVRLEQVKSSAPDEALRKLAAALLDFVEAERPRIVETDPGRVQRLLSHVRNWAREIFTRRRLRAFLLVALTIGGAYAVLDIALLAFLAIAPESGATEFLRVLVSKGELAALDNTVWFFVRAVLEGGTGILTLTGVAFISLHHEGRGLGLAIAALILELTVVNLLVFYQDQWKALISTVLEYIVMIAAFSYRRVYVQAEEDEAANGIAHAVEADLTVRGFIHAGHAGPLGDSAPESQPIAPDTA